jgi:hypothetical protein
MAVANRADAGGRLEARSGLFAGRLPDDVGIANTAVEWSGVRWTMVIWWAIAGSSRRARMRLMAHEAFHRLQPELGLVATGELNDHLDTADGRFWLQLEWNALQAALGASGEERRRAAADALAFRAARRARFPAAAPREIALEIHEGVPEYTGMRIAGYTREQVVQAVRAKREQDTGFVRSFAYMSGPLYGFLLDDADAAWRSRLGPDMDLGARLGTALGIQVAPADAATKLAEPYGGSALRTSEDERERKRQAQLATWRASLIDGPVLIVDLEAVKSFTFDPLRVFPFAEKQTVYTTRTLIADWGVLTVEDGAILEDENTKTGRVSLAKSSPVPGSGDQAPMSGPGWKLQPAEGWKLVPAERAGDLALRRP